MMLQHVEIGSAACCCASPLLAQDRVPWAAMGEPLEVRPLLRATRHEDLAPETKALKELKPSFTRQVGGTREGNSGVWHYCKPL